MPASTIPLFPEVDPARQQPDFLSLELTISDPDAIAELCQRAEGRDRDEYAAGALRLGLLALRQARGQIDAAALRREGDQLLSQVQRALAEHGAHLNQHLTGTLKDYFDPQSGRFNERVDRLLRKDGELESLLSRKLCGDESDLSRTLAALVGADSPLFRLLSPNESEGLVHALRATVTGELEEQRLRVLKEFSLDNKEGALCRLVGEISDHSGKLKQDLKGQIDQVVREFSLDDEDSALSRLVRQVDRAQRTIAAEFSLDNSESALSRMTRQMENTNQVISKHLTLDDDKSALSRLKRELLDVLTGHEKRAVEFQEQVQVALASMQARRAEMARSTRRGTEFEAAVFELLQSYAQQGGDVATATGQQTGLIKNCKVGDATIELGPDSAAGGARIVVEAKEDASCNLAQALEEMETARKNREAQTGLFVCSSKTAPAGWEPLARYGNDVVVVWGAEDPGTDVYLKIGLSVAKALCTRQALARENQVVDFTPLDEALLDIEKQAQLLDEIRGLTDTIRGNSDKIQNRLRISCEKIIRQAALLHEQVGALKQRLATPDSAAS